MVKISLYEIIKAGKYVQSINKEKASNAVDTLFDNVETNLKRVCESESSYSNHLTQYLISRGGKRLRPLLVILTSANRAAIEEIVDVATAAELIHTASLVHDDIVDDSSLRRGVQTINNKWNNSVAVLVGDYLFAKAFEILSDQKGNVMKHYTNAISLMSIGELEQLGNRFNPQKTREQYYQEVYGKTSILISTCCKTGGIISNMSDTEVESLSYYGREIGYAFQIVDDILDIRGDVSSLGKPVFKDLLEGNVTLPMIELLDASSSKGLIEEIIFEKKFNEENLKFIYNQINEYDVISNTFDTAKNHVKNALLSLEKINDFPQKERLKTIAEFIIKRKN